MKAQRLPQDHIVHEVIENLQEIIWEKIGSAVKSFLKMFIENLLQEELLLIKLSQIIVIIYQKDLLLKNQNCNLLNHLIILM